jgi:hypothetical protein
MIPTRRGDIYGMSDRFLYQSPSGGMSRLGRSLVIVTLLLLVSLVCFGISAHRFYRYEAGTPTTATVVRCESHGKAAPATAHGTSADSHRPASSVVRRSRLDPRWVFV